MNDKKDNCDKFLFPTEYMKLTYGNEWYIKYKYIEVISDKKSKKGNKICYLYVFPKCSDDGYIDYRTLTPIPKTEADKKDFPLDAIRGVELLSRYTGKYYRKYFIKKITIKKSDYEKF
jgi:hypothetical protein